MLATAWPYQQQYQHNHNHAHFLPTRPSPLSPRSSANVNACPRPQFWSSTTRNMGSNTCSGSENENHSSGNNGSSGNEKSEKHDQSQSQKGVAFSKREIKSNPVVRRARQTPDEARERRREMFIRKVERGRDERRWDGRSDQILRSDYMAQRRKWQEERDREARFFFDVEFEDDVENDQTALLSTTDSWPLTPRLHAQPDDAEQEVDEIAQMEEEELMAILEMQEQMEEMQAIPSSPTRYGSDDEEFDEIFMELVSSQQQLQNVSFRVEQQQQVDTPQQEDLEMMDTT